MENEEPKCQDCGKELTQQEDVPRIDPYLEEVGGIKKYVVVCDDCYKQSVLDI